MMALTRFINWGIRILLEVNMNRVEMAAAEALLDRRLKINFPAPWILRLFGKKTIGYWMKLPVYENVIQMARLFCQMDIDVKKLMDGDMGTLMGYIAKHGVTASRLIAYGMVRGSLSARIWNRILAKYLRTHMDMRGMAELMKILVWTCNGEDFVSIIASASNLRMTEPTLSQPKKKGS